MSEIVCCNKLTKRYGSVTALKDLNLTLESGKIVVIFPDRGEKYLSTSLFDGK